MIFYSVAWDTILPSTEPLLDWKGHGGYPGVWNASTETKNVENNVCWNHGQTSDTRMWDGDNRCTWHDLQMREVGTEQSYCILSTCSLIQSELPLYHTTYNSCYEVRRLIVGFRTAPCAAASHTDLGTSDSEVPRRKVAFSVNSEKGWFTAQKVDGQNGCHPVSIAGLLHLPSSERSELVTT